MKKKPPGNLSNDEIIQLEKMYIKNARELLIDSKILLKENRRQRAFALAVLSLEEIGKAKILATAFYIGKKDQKRWTIFWKNLRNHRLKQRVNRPDNILFRKRFKTKISKIDINAMEGMKQFALYVSVLDNNILEPHVVFRRAKRRVERLIEFVEERLYDYEKDLKNQAKQNREMLLTEFIQQLYIKNIKTGEMELKDLSAAELDRVTKVFEDSIGKGKMDESLTESEFKGSPEELIKLLFDELGKI